MSWLCKWLMKLHWPDIWDEFTHWQDPAKDSGDPVLLKSWQNIVKSVQIARRFQKRGSRAPMIPLCTPIIGEPLEKQDGVEKVIAYGSSTLTKAERNYSVTRREMLALISFLRRFRSYLLGKPFVVRTDHAALTWLQQF